jgi:hypothetical protein
MKINDDVALHFCETLAPIQQYQRLMTRMRAPTVEDELGDFSDAPLEFVPNFYLISVAEHQRTFALNSMVELRSRAPPHRPTAHRLPIRDARYCDQSGLQAGEHRVDNADERCATPQERAAAAGWSRGILLRRRGGERGGLKVERRPLLCRT